MTRAGSSGRRAGGLLCLAAVLVVAGCSGGGDAAGGGSLTSGDAGLTATEAPAGVVPSAAGKPGGTGGRASTGGATSGAATGATGATGTTGATGAATTGSTTGGGLPGVTPRRVSGPLGPGVSATTIKVGFVYSSDLEKVGISADNAFAGDLPDEKADVLAMVKGFNAAGGLAGRKIIPVFYDNKYTSGKTTQQREQELCSQFTEDTPVFSVEPYFTPTENQVACLGRKGTLLVIGGGGQARNYFDQAMLDRYPTLWMLQAPSEDRMARSYVSRLKAAGYFTKGAKVGVLYADQASVRRAYNGAFKAALKAAGVTVAQDAALFPPANPDELGTSETQIQNAVIRFAANQISHVIMFDVHGWSHKDAFMRYAEQQRYRPRYGMNSSAGVDEKDVVSGTDLTPQFHGSVYMSWAPMADLAVLKPTARTQQCYGMLRSAGRPVPTTNVAVITLSRCEYLFFLKDAMDRAPELNFKGFATAAERMGQHLGIKAPSERFGPHRHDGIDQYQMLTYDFACHNAGRVNCWRGTGPRYTF